MRRAWSRSRRLRELAASHTARDQHRTSSSRRVSRYDPASGVFASAARDPTSGVFASAASHPACDPASVFTSRAERGPEFSVLAIAARDPASGVFASAARDPASGVFASAARDPTSGVFASAAHPGIRRLRGEQATVIPHPARSRHPLGVIAQRRRVPRVSPRSAPSQARRVPTRIRRHRGRGV